MAEEIKQANKKIEWETKIGNKEEKSFLWYIIFSFLILGFLIFAWYSKNFLFAVILLLGSVLLIRQPADRKIKCELLEDGLRLEESEKIYHYQDILGFAILEGEDNNLLVLHIKSTFNQYLKINFPKSKTKEIKEFLQDKVPEMEYELGLLDVLIDRFF
jgi:hypothetical protein